MHSETDQFIRLYWKSKDDFWIAKKLKTTNELIALRRNELGFRRNDEPELDIRSAEEQKIIECPAEKITVPVKKGIWIEVKSTATTEEIKTRTQKFLQSLDASKQTIVKGAKKKRNEIEDFKWSE